MKAKTYIIGILSTVFLLYGCSDSATDSGSDPSNPDLDPALIGNWVIDPTAGSLGVGPAKDELSWWTVTEEEIESLVPCLYDDIYVFNADGTYKNMIVDEAWLETWQGVDENRCGEPIPPHDGSTIGEWTAVDGKITITGEGLYLGMPKVHNEGEDGSPVNDTIIYDYELSNNDELLEVTITGFNSALPDAAWYFRFVRE